MSFELVDNLFQVVVLFGAAVAATVLSVRRKERGCLILAFGYACFAMGTLFYVLYLAIMGTVPQVFYVSEISWLAAYLFFLSLQISADGGAARGVPVASRPLCPGFGGQRPSHPHLWPLLAGLRLLRPDCGRERLPERMPLAGEGRWPVVGRLYADRPSPCRWRCTPFLAP